MGKKNKNKDKFTCPDCKGTTHGNECGNPDCPNMPCCGQDAEKCTCNRKPPRDQLLYDMYIKDNASVSLGVKLVVQEALQNNSIVGSTLEFAATGHETMELYIESQNIKATITVKTKI